MVLLVLALIIVTPLAILCIALGIRKDGRDLMRQKASLIRYYGRTGLVGSAERRMEDQMRPKPGPAAPDIVPVTSGASSPTHALLPHVDTSTSVATSGAQETSCQGASSLFGSFASGLEKCKLRRATFCGGAAAAAAAVDDDVEGRRPSKKSFMDSIAKSISFPSPKRAFRTPSLKQNSNNKYEIKVEHQELKESSGGGESTPQVR